MTISNLLMVKFAKYFLLFLILVILLSLLGSFIIPGDTTRHLLLTVAIISASLGALVGMYYWGSTLRTLDEITDQAERINREDFQDKSPVAEISSPTNPSSLKEVINQLEKKVKELSTERDHFHAILQNMTEGLVVTDDKGVIQSANPSFYRLFPLESRCEGKTILEALRNHEIHNTLFKSLKTQSSQEEEVSFQVLDSTRTLLLHVTPLFDPKGLKGAILVFLDVTPLRKLEDARREFVANVSHELKTPLTSILGYAETLQKGTLRDSETTHRFLKKIERNANQLQNLIEDLLRLSEIESGRIEYRPVKVGLKELFEEIHLDFSDVVQKKSILLKSELSEELCVHAEPASIKQIMVNLVSNALKYTPPGGTISLEAHTEGKWAKITVSDTGLGIPSEDIPHIFQRFYRVDKARSRDMGGTGLGLAIVKHLVNRQGGEVSVQSKLNKGSQFSFTVPINK